MKSINNLLIFILLILILFLSTYFIINTKEFTEEFTELFGASNLSPKPNSLNSNIDTLHKELYYLIKKNNPPSQSIMQNLTHPDYKDIIKLLSKKKTNYNANSLDLKNDKNILQTLSKDYFISLHAIYNKKYDFLKRVKNDYLLSCTGAYTSSFKRPVGLFSENGKILNPAIRSWTGLLVVKNGIAKILNAKKIDIGFKKLNIVESIKDLKEFLEWIENNNLSVLQSHMIVNNGKIQTHRKKLFKRRVIFEDKYGVLHIYDSGNKKISLFDLAQLLVTKYHAQKAINLDMGTFNYAYSYSDGITKKIGLIDNPKILSNIIEVKKR